jgi:hypothetical protein
MPISNNYIPQAFLLPPPLIHKGSIVFVSDTHEKSALPSLGSWWIFLAGLVIFLVFQTGLVLEVQLSRALPPEAKDAYRYIFSAVQLPRGFNSNTPALKDLRTQSNPEPGDSIDRQNLKWDNYHSLFFSHVLLHSALLQATSWILGVPLGIAYKVICVLGSLLIAGAISYFLLTITDRTSAGIALASLALAMFPIQGIHYVVPTNICMAVGLLLFTIVLRTGGKSKWLLFGFSFILVFLHRMGIIYAGLGVLATVFLRYKEENIKRLVFDLLPTLVILGIYVFIAYIFPLPVFRLSPMAKPADTSFLREVVYNGLDLFNQFGAWFLSHGVVIWPQPFAGLFTNNPLAFLGVQIFGLCLLVAPWLVKKTPGENHVIIRWIICLCGALIVLPIFSALFLIVIIGAGWLYQPPEKKTSFQLAFVVFLFLLFPSLLHVMYIAEPGHPIIRADLTNRLWVPFAVVLAAIFGRGLWWVFQEIRRGSYGFIPKSVKDQEWSKKVLQPRYMWGFLVLFLLAGYAPHLAHAYSERANIKHFMIIRQNVNFNPEQIQYVFQHTTPQDIIVYDDDFIRHYYLCHGGLWRRAIYLPLLPLPKDFTFKPSDIKYEVSWNPYLSIQSYENVRDIAYPLSIPGDSIYTLQFDPDFQLAGLQILPAVSPKGTGSTKLRIIRKSAQGGQKSEDIDLKGNNWQTYSLIPEPGGSLTLINLDRAKPLLIAGLNFGGQPDRKFLWPWHGVRAVTMEDKQIHITRTDKLPIGTKIKGITYAREVLQDTGSTVLWKLTAEQAKSHSLQLPRSGFSRVAGGQQK